MLFVLVYDLCFRSFVFSVRRDSIVVRLVLYVVCSLSVVVCCLLFN